MSSKKIKNSKHTLSVFGLIMTNVIAIDSLRSLPLSAVYGTSLIFYYLVAAVAFFLPSAFVAAELATGWPETGGIYIWTREAFGKKIGFMTIFLQWFYNLCWYPTIMALVAATIAYLINPELVNNKIYMFLIILILFWTATFLNCFGMRTSNFMSTFGAIIGTLAPIGFIIILSFIWIFKKHPAAINFNLHDFLPNLSSFQNLTLLTAMLYGLVGMEMSAAHAREVKNPQRDYPRAMIWSTVIILFSMIFGSLAVAIVVPPAKLNIVSGLLEAFRLFFIEFNLQGLMPLIACLIIIGALAGVAAWILSPSKGLLVASEDGSLPKALSKTGKHGAPTRILLIQGILFTGLSSLFIFMPSVSSTFWVLTDITAILSLLVYVLMFTAALVLRYKFPNIPRSFKVPGGLLGLWFFCLLGLTSCVFTLIVGFLPPSQIAVGNIWIYEIILISGVLLGCVIPWILSGLNKNKK